MFKFFLLKTYSTTYLQRQRQSAVRNAAAVSVVYEKPNKSWKINVQFSCTQAYVILQQQGQFALRSITSDVHEQDWQRHPDDPYHTLLKGLTRPVDPGSSVGTS